MLERNFDVNNRLSPSKPRLLTTLFMVAVSLLCNRASAAVFELQGSGQVLDGWVSSGGTAAFDGNVLRGHGNDGSSYDRTLIRFDLTGIDASRFGSVKKAVLRLRVLEAQLPGEVATQIAPLQVAWTQAATWDTADGKIGWPQDRNRASNIDYAMDLDLAVSQAIDASGIVEIDLTAVVNAWLYEGLANHGLLIRTGGAIFGRPNAGTWQLAFAASESKKKNGPALVVKLAGEPPRLEDLSKRALALYPSALLPPVRDPYYFVWYGLPREVCRQLTAANMTTYTGMDRWMNARGGIDLAWAEGGPSPWLSSEASWITYYLSTAQGNLGYCMHEWHLEPERQQWAATALREAERMHPESFSAFYFQGQQTMANLAAAGELDLLILEGYTHVTSQFPREGFAIGMDGIKQRIDVARKAGASERLVNMCGHIAPASTYHEGHVLTADIIDRQLRELRTHAPEMPGVGFYYVGGEELALQCDTLARKHFIDPAPEVSFVQPKFAARLNTPHVTLRAQAEPKGNRAVVRYRWFIDNRLVSETKQPQYRWDLRGDRNGLHLITVHAIDNGFNRAASQIPVRVDFPEARHVPGTVPTR